MEFSDDDSISSSVFITCSEWPDESELDMDDFNESQQRSGRDHQSDLESEMDDDDQQYLHPCHRRDSLTTLLREYGDRSRMDPYHLNLLRDSEYYRNIVPSVTFSDESNSYAIDWAGFDPYHSLLRDPDDPRNGSNEKFLLSYCKDLNCIQELDESRRRAKGLTQCDNVGFILLFSALHDDLYRRNLIDLPTNISYLDLLAIFFLRLELKACRSSICGQYQRELGLHGPHNDTWPGLKECAVQIAACERAWHLTVPQEPNCYSEATRKNMFGRPTWISNFAIIKRWIGVPRVDNVIIPKTDIFQYHMYGTTEGHKSKDCPERADVRLFPDGIQTVSFACKAPINPLDIDILFEWLGHYTLITTDADIQGYKIPTLLHGMMLLPDIGRTRQGFLTVLQLEGKDLNLEAVCADGSNALLPLQAPQLSAVVPKIKRIGICIKRLMALAQSLPGRGSYLPMLLAELEARPVLVPRGAERHEECLADHCVYDVVNHTSVSQLHKCSGAGRFGAGQFGAGRFGAGQCRLTSGDMFSRALLDQAARAGRPTAWALDGRTLLEPWQEYMAVSHVWADGTGAGVGHPGRVNGCLWAFFRRIAEQTDGCEGIWWDAVCIPGEPRAKAAVLGRMHEHYANALFTLVHDRFLLATPWAEDGTPCMAVLFSPWFGRGWTALELAKSRAVKVAFLAPSAHAGQSRDAGAAGACVLKELDSEVVVQLGRPCSNGHRIASCILAQYRRGGVWRVNEILAMLKPRTTSWAADMPIITALLAELQSADIANLSQLKINQAIFEKFPCLMPENLFHTGQSGVGGFAWCPASILDLGVTHWTVDDSNVEQFVLPNGDICGLWETAVIPYGSHSASLAHPIATPAATDPLYRAHLAQNIASAQSPGSTILYLLCRSRESLFVLEEPFAGQEVPAIMVEVLEDHTITTGYLGKYEEARKYVDGLQTDRYTRGRINMRLGQCLNGVPFVCRHVGCVYVKIDWLSVAIATWNYPIYLTCSQEGEKWSSPNMSFAEFYWTRTGLLQERQDPDFFKRLGID
ncbi:hypothetical protein DFH27DRAFT_552468 [Peziza echinospora]|nr:hypothetical protein DFH27DRAFT_552468 [Peziza echinospora]